MGSVMYCNNSSTDTNEQINFLEITPIKEENTINAKSKPTPFDAIHKENPLSKLTFISEAEFEFKKTSLQAEREMWILTHSLLSLFNINFHPSSQLDRVKYDPVILGDKGVYYGEWNNRYEREGIGIFISDQGFIYKGEWERNLPNFKGILIDAKGNIYIGHFEDGKENGDGILIIFDKDFTDDECIDNDNLDHSKLINNIKQNFKDYDESAHDADVKYIYTGNFRNGLQDGKGKEIFRNGSIFEGEFKLGAKNGEGCYTSDEADKINGLFFNNKLIEIKHIQFHSDNCYKGKLTEKGLNGIGKFKWQDGSNYIGNYEDNQKSGKGIYYFDETNNFYYDGHWKCGKMHGEGMIFKNGTIHKGIWRYGKLIK